MERRRTICRPWSTPRWCSSDTRRSSTSESDSDSDPSSSAWWGCSHDRSRASHTRRRQYSCDYTVAQTFQGSPRWGPVRRSLASAGSIGDRGPGLWDDVGEFVSSVWALVSDEVVADGPPPVEKAIHSLSLTDPPARRTGTSPWEPLRQPGSLVLPSSKSSARNFRTSHGIYSGLACWLRQPETLSHWTEQTHSYSFVWVDPLQCLPTHKNAGTR